jgi:hypothetical protein
LVLHRSIHHQRGWKNFVRDKSGVDWTFTPWEKRPEEEAVFCMEIILPVIFHHTTPSVHIQHEEIPKYSLLSL